MATSHTGTSGAEGGCGDVDGSGLDVDVVHRTPDDHGVTRFGVELSQALATRGVDVRDRWVGASQPGFSWSLGRVVHLQFSDALWGRDAAAAAVAAVRVVSSARGPVVATLHDLPDPAGASGRWPPRARAYRRVADAVDRVVVGSDHERGRLSRARTRTPVEVVPNPVPSLPTPPADAVRRWRVSLHDTLGRDRLVGLLGWIHPDQDCATVVDELAGRQDVGLALLGAAAAGHDDHVVELRARAAAADLPLVVTGWLSEPDRVAAMGAVDLAVVAHPAPSAPDAALAWMAAGRIPMVRASSSARELAERAPDAVRTWRTGCLAAMLDEPPPRVPGLSDEVSPGRAADRYVEVYRSCR